jgi:hypothetical protein
MQAYKSAATDTTICKALESPPLTPNWVENSIWRGAQDARFRHRAGYPLQGADNLTKPYISDTPALPLIA